MSLFAILARSSGEILNCSYQPSVLRLTSLHLSSAYQFFYTRKTSHNSQKTSRHANEPATAVTAVTVDCQQLTTVVILSGNRLIQNGKKQHVKTATMIVYTFTA